MTTTMSSAVEAVWPALPLEGWRDTYATLHMWTQIVGKTRLALAPMENHWWQVTLAVTPRGLATPAMPFRTRTLSVEFDFLDDGLYLRTNEGETRRLALTARAVADFYAEYRDVLRELGIQARFMPSPVEVPVAVPFLEDFEHRTYDADAVRRWWRVLVQVDRVLKRFRGRFLGKASPVHFFWGSFDLASTRFSGRPAPRHPGGAPNCPDSVMVEAYSHECSSCGFWPGGGVIDEPALYAYTYPQPAGYAERAVGPAGVRYSKEAGEYLLPYASVRDAASPDEAILEFCQTTYDAAADLAAWDRHALDRPRESWP